MLEKIYAVKYVSILDNKKYIFEYIENLTSYNL